jgi:hypothetical protein
MTLARPMFPPVDSTRRRFLSQAAGVAAGGTVLALATISPALAAAAPPGALDPVFGLIEAHRTARAAYLVALAEHTRLDRLLDDTDNHMEREPDDESDESEIEPSLGSFDRMADQSRAWRQSAGELCFSIDAGQDDAQRGW